MIALTNKLERIVAQLSLPKPLLVEVDLNTAASSVACHADLSWLEAAHTRCVLVSLWQCRVIDGRDRIAGDELLVGGSGRR